MDVTQAQVAKMDDLLQHLHEESSKVEGLIKSQVESALRDMKPGMKTQDPNKNPLEPIRLSLSS